MEMCKAATRARPASHVARSANPAVGGSIGIRGLWRRRHGLEAEPDSRLRAANFTAVTIVTVANGGDNMALYVSLFSVHSAAEVAL